MSRSLSREPFTEGLDDRSGQGGLQDPAMGPGAVRGSETQGVFSIPKEPESLLALGASGGEASRALRR